MTTINGRKVVLFINGVEVKGVNVKSVTRLAEDITMDNSDGWLEGMGAREAVTVEFTRQEKLTPELKDAHRRYLAGEISDDDI